MHVPLILGDRPSILRRILKKIRQKIDGMIEYIRSIIDLFDPPYT